MANKKKNIKKTVELSKIELPKPPKIVEPPKVNYVVKFEKGELAVGKTTLRAVCYANDSVFDHIESAPVNNGYGYTEAEALADFIRRNSSNILDRIFDKCLMI